MPAAGVIHVVCMLWTTAQEPGVLLPPLGVIVHVAAITVLAATHALLHLGVRSACVFMAVCVTIEWTCEQLNVSYDGFIFGRLAYSDQIGPKLGDIPIIVPFAYASLVWPSVVITSLLLHERVCYLSSKGESWVRMAARSVLTAMVHTAWSPSVEPLVLKFGALTYLDTTHASKDPYGHAQSQTRPARRLRSHRPHHPTTTRASVAGAAPSARSSSCQ